MATASKREDQLAVAKILNHVPWCEQYEQMISGMLYDLLARNKPMSLQLTGGTSATTPWSSRS